MTEKYPKITIAVPAYNEARHIGQCLESLVKQDYPGETEIIVADAFSGDETRKIVEEFRKDHKNIRLIDNPDKIQTFARNRIFRESDADFVAYIDAHSYAEPDWLRNLYESLAELMNKNEKVAGVGSIHFDAAETPFSKATTAAFNSIAGGATATSYASKKDIQKVHTAYACLYRKQALEEAGYYDTGIDKGEDLHLNLRLTRRLGYDLYVNPRAVTYYHKRESFAALLKQMYSYGVWRMIVMRDLSIYNPAPFIPPFWILVLAALAALSFSNEVYLPLLGIALGVYILVMGAFSIYKALRNRANPALIFLVFLCIHFGYGAGMIAGIFKGKRKG